MFSQRFKQLRKEKKLSQAKIAEDLDMSQATIASWENGSRMPLADMMPHIADYFRVSTDYLLGTSDVPDLVKDETVPLTDEVRILAEGIDKLPQRQKEMAMNVVKTILSQYSDYFEKGADENDP